MTHRRRLTVLLTSSVSVGLAVVFLAVLGEVREQSIERRFDELEQSVGRMAKDWKSPKAFEEIQEAFPGSDFAVTRPDGTVVASTSKRAIPFSDGRSERNHRVYFGLRSDGVSVVGTSSLGETEAGLSELGLVLAGLWLPLVLLTAGVSWYAGGLVLRPVTELVQSADHLSLSSKDDILQTSDKAEFAVLAESLNQMVARVRNAARVQEQFASDAAHELRSPLAVLRTRIETTLLKDRDSVEYQEALAAMLGQVERLTSTVETLLASARATPVEASPLDLDSAVKEIAEQWRQDAGLESSRVEVTTEAAVVEIAFEELRIILVNLLDNAVRYSPSDRPIVIRLERINGMANLSVRDFGPGLTAEAKLRAFDRFYRSENDRNRESGGAGIGLSVVRRIAESRGGKVSFGDVEMGAMVTVVLPLVIEE